MKKFIFYSTTFILLAGLPALAGAKNAEGIVASVNGDKISAHDLKSELELRRRQDPSFTVTDQTLSDQLEVMINRRILIQEAQKRKLAEEERFVNTIRNFWEQTLIRDLMKDLSKELGGDAAVEGAAFQNWLDQKKKGSNIEIDETAKTQLLH